jgi:hypothetical protein
MKAQEVASNKVDMALFAGQRQVLDGLMSDIHWEDELEGIRNLLDYIFDCLEDTGVCLLEAE